MYHCTDDSCEPKQSFQLPKPSNKDQAIIDAFIGYDHSFGDHSNQLENEVNMQAEEIEYSEYVESIVQLVNLFKNTVIMSELQSKDDWNKNLPDQLKNNKEIPGINFLDYHKMENIVVSKGLTKEQWNRLLCLSLIANDNAELTKISKKHLQKARDMAIRLLEKEQQSVVFALVHAIEKYMPKEYFTEN